MTSEIQAKADFSLIRYASCWEDADILLTGLDVQPGDTILSVASAGDNSLAILAKNPARVIALDLSPAQLACLELRVAAYQTLRHPELLAFLGARPHDRRADLYQRCRPLLAPETQAFWDRQPGNIDQGFGNVGRFERYLALFGRRILPWLVPASARRALLQPRTRDERAAFYDRRWNTRRWRTVFRLFFSRRVMGLLGRDPEFFDYVEADVAESLLARTRHALVELDPLENPYLQWILLGRYGDALPFALRPENFDAIRANLDRLAWHCASVEDFVDSCDPATLDGFNLSDIFEYMSEAQYGRLLEALARTGRPGARLVYWNMLAPRRRPARLADRLANRTELARTLYAQDKAWFYGDFVVEEVVEEVVEKVVEKVVEEMVKGDD